jgi:hypothetical protein
MPKSNPKSSNPLGPIHTASIRRVADVPKAAAGHYNTTPGTREKPIITAGGEKKK